MNQYEVGFYPWFLMSVLRVPYDYPSMETRN